MAIAIKFRPTSVTSRFTTSVAKPAQRAYLTLDAWRGFASLWVVMRHTPTRLLHPELNANPFYAFGHEGLAGVWIFFVISGYCIANAAASNLQRNHTLGKFITARLRRIYPPCLLAVAVYFVVAASGQWAVAHGFMRTSFVPEQPLHHGWLYYVANMTLTQLPLRQDLITGICWTLCYEVGFYLLVGLALCAARSIGGARGMLNLLHGLTIATLIGLVVDRSRIGYPFDLWPLFGLGALAFDLLQRPQDWQPKVSALLIGALTLAFAFKSPLIGEHGVGAQSFLIALTVAVLLILLRGLDAALLSLKPIRFLAWVGAFSYSLYLTHYMIVLMVARCFEAAHLGLKLCYLCSFVALAASVAYAKLFYNLVERRCLNNAKPAPVSSQTVVHHQAPVFASPQSAVHHKTPAMAGGLLTNTNLRYVGRHANIKRAA